MEQLGGLRRRTWEHEVHFAFSEGGAQYFDAYCKFTVSSNDSAAQIKAAMGAAIRACTVAETGLVVEANQIILPDCTRV